MAATVSITARLYDDNCMFVDADNTYDTRLHRSENWVYPLYFLCSSPVLPSFKHTWHCMADKVVTSTQQHFIIHDTVRFLANMLLS